MHELVTSAIMELFVDDRGSTANTLDEGMQKLGAVFNCIQKEELSLSPSKCKLFMTEAVFAGTTIGPNGIKPDPAKLMAIVNWPQPNNASHLCGFLGLMGWFRDLMKGYAKIE